MKIVLNKPAGSSQTIPQKHTKSAKYFIKNSLKLNAKKTSYMIIVKQTEANLNLIIDGSSVKKVNNMKYLGINHVVKV